MSGLIKQVFIALSSFSGALASIISAHDHVKCVCLNNQQCMTQPAFVNLHAVEYIERLCYYPFAVN